MTPFIRSAAAIYPGGRAARDRWISSRRGPRRAIDASRAVDAFLEQERTERGDVASVAAIFLANRECPWRCLMCDLWKNTTATTVPHGAIAAQIRGALASGHLPGARRAKLYNAGSFFDPAAIPTEDYADIAASLSGFERVMVESHPALIGDSCRRFRDLLGVELEVAIGLETAHPEVLAKLNKRMTLGDFDRAAQRLRHDGIGLRVFVLLGLPFLSAEQADRWMRCSIEIAFDAGATAVSIIPTRSGNGAMEQLQAAGQFVPPTLERLEKAVSFGIAQLRGRVFADLWDLARLDRCEDCFDARAQRLGAINLTQVMTPEIQCSHCGAGAHSAGSL